MPLFQFELAPVEKVEPWGDPGNLSLSLYALTDGHFSISVGRDTLFQYTPEIITRWKLPHETADYQVASFARDIFEMVPAAVAPMPAFFENIVRDEALFRKLRAAFDNYSVEKVPSGIIDKLEVEKTNKDFNREHYKAFRWLGERSVWLNYLTAFPDLWFVRVGNDVWIQWDNTHKKFEGIDVWTARRGAYSISVEEFLAESHSFSERLLSAMESRIVSIENGTARPQIPLNITLLRNQLLEFKTDFKKLLSANFQSDIDWEASEKTMQKIANENTITLPPV